MWATQAENPRRAEACATRRAQGCPRSIERKIQKRDPRNCLAGLASSLDFALGASAWLAEALAGIVRRETHTFSSMSCRDCKGLKQARGVNMKLHCAKGGDGRRRLARCPTTVSGHCHRPELEAGRPYAVSLPAAAASSRPSRLSSRRSQHPQAPTVGSGSAAAAAAQAAEAAAASGPQNVLCTVGCGVAVRQLVAGQALAGDNSLARPM